MGDSMKTKFFMQTDSVVAGMTLKDETEKEQNNMALHACENKEHILENRQKLANLLNCNLDHWVCPNQTHSANFHKVTKDDFGKGAKDVETSILNTDTLYTYEPNVLLCSFHADCVPVVFYHKSTGVIGAIHSGWKGTVQEITYKVLTHLIENEHCQPEDFVIHIGPAISQDMFEVDEDVYIQFKQLGYADEFIEYRPERNKYHINNQLTVKKQCMLAGISENCIHVDPTCTYQHEEYFSYRQDKKAGRHLTFIMKKQ